MTKKHEIEAKKEEKLFYAQEKEKKYKQTKKKVSMQYHTNK
jgi:hypothetical protein